MKDHTELLKDLDYESPANHVCKSAAKAIRELQEQIKLLAFEPVLEKLQAQNESLQSLNKVLEKNEWCRLDAESYSSGRIAELEELTDRQVKRTGELTGQVDTLLEQVKELEAKQERMRERSRLTAMGDT